MKSMKSVKRDLIDVNQGTHGVIGKLSIEQGI
jgi:hypothetical protein